MKTDERSTTTGQDMTDEVFWAKDAAGKIVMIGSRLAWSAATSW